MLLSNIFAYWQTRNMKNSTRLIPSCMQFCWTWWIRIQNYVRLNTICYLLWNLVSFIFREGILKKVILYQAAEKTISKSVKCSLSRTEVNFWRNTLCMPQLFFFLLIWFSENNFYQIFLKVWENLLSTFVKVDSL